MTPEDVRHPGFKMQVAVPDMINHPPHYTSAPARCSGCGKPIECIDITRHMTFTLGNALKYLWRVAFGKKPGADPVEDLGKVQWYVADEISERRRTAA